MKIVFDNEDFDGQFLRALSYAAYGGADIGECFETANNIKEGDRDSWYDAWTKTAQRMRQDAEESLKGGHNVSARRSYRRHRTTTAPQSSTSETMPKTPVACKGGKQVTTASPGPPNCSMHPSKR